MAAAGQHIRQIDQRAGIVRRGGEIAAEEGLRAGRVALDSLGIELGGDAFLAAALQQLRQLHARQGEIGRQLHRAAQLRLRIGKAFEAPEQQRMLDTDRGGIWGETQRLAKQFFGPGAVIARTQQLGKRREHGWVLRGKCLRAPQLGSGTGEIVHLGEVHAVGEVRRAVALQSGRRQPQIVTGFLRPPAPAQ